MPNGPRLMQPGNRTIEYPAKMSRSVVNCLTGAHSAARKVSRRASGKSRAQSAGVRMSPVRTCSVLSANTAADVDDVDQLE